MPPLQITEVSLLALATAGYAVTWVFHLWALRRGNEELGRRATAATRAVFALQVAWFVVRVYRAGRLPIFNAHEFSAMFGGGIVLVYLVFERRSRRRELAVWALPAALALLAYGWQYSSNVEPLIPIFRSLWLKVHILTAVVAYSAFATTFAASCLYLFSRRRAVGPPPGSLPGKRLSIFSRAVSPRMGVPSPRESAGRGALASRPNLELGSEENRQPRQEGGAEPTGSARLDTVAYQAATVGFSFLTACVITGAIWAEQVWGRFWSWDPKETWSLITWLVFAAYLHTRYNRGWKENRAAVLGIVGFLLVLMTYLGVELLAPGQHDFLLWRKE